MLGIVICHKSLAFEMVNTAHSILGFADDIAAFSNEKLTTENAIQKVEQLIGDTRNQGPVVFMTDMRGGNCWTIAQMVARNKSDYYVLSGVNLPMVLSYLTKKDNLGIRELTDIMEKVAHRGIFLE